MASMKDVGNDVSLMPYLVVGAHGHLINGFGELRLDSDKSEKFVALLKRSRWGSAVENDFDLQSLCQRTDGTKLLSAMAPIEEFFNLLIDAGSDFAAIRQQAELWQAAGNCNEVIIHFTDLQKHTNHV